ncbi:DUF3336 domain-containing protein [Marinobacter zhanjiangensis]|uniref:PNPLA domain-containing protein n=1 Tax=Marinobacter zhanjiangensis TaxID=578215 RepID=A0ABQ3B5I1_9GAMM|nr:DUF3336 domain-containing protein [Marinobacter zhanjiangensis]GGY74823.1 hypothetical protein GCM10007071_22490 [Marinobacter zhanjiangensis]
MSTNARLRKQLNRELDSARSFEQWHDIAWKLDELDGNLKWRDEGATAMLHEPLIREHIRLMHSCRHKGDPAALTRVLQESLYRHLGELSNPDLYAMARTGTKQVVGEFLDEVRRAMNYICDKPQSGMSVEQKLQLFQRADKVFGRPALMLSGGAAFGIYHFGVTRALWRRNLLPDVIAGSSMGAVVAAAICSRNSKELDSLFDDPEQVHLDALRWHSPGELWGKGHAMDQAQLQDHIRTNIGTGSFREAFEHSGRALNISVSPTRTRQKPRLLNELTAPDVTIDSAVLASCAVPGIYPSVTLQARDKSDSRKVKEIPYMPTERWIDGTVHGDLPLVRMARLHNINKTIVSQANPHVLPFISHHSERGLSASVKQAASSLVHAHVATLLELTRNTWSSSTVRPLIEQAHSMATQSYLGDINIQFPFKPTLYRKVLSNPSAKDLAMYIQIGEQATWPMMAMIEDQTLISRTFRECIGRLKHRAERSRSA